MKKYLLNLGKTYLRSLLYFAVILLIWAIVEPILNDYDYSFENFKFWLIDGAILEIIGLSILNIPPLLVLCIHKLNKWEVLLECIVFIIFYAFEEDVIFAVVPEKYLWEHVVEWENSGLVWWASDGMLYVYSVVLTIIVCFGYFGIKKYYQKRHQQKEISD